MRDNFTAEERAILDATPMCSVPDCEWKAYIDTGKCFAHSTGRPLLPSGPNDPYPINGPMKLRDRGEVS